MLCWTLQLSFTEQNGGVTFHQNDIFNIVFHQSANHQNQQFAKRQILADFNFFKYKHPQAYSI